MIKQEVNTVKYSFMAKQCGDVYIITEEAG